jgi:hypothetical protein
MVRRTPHLARAGDRERNGHLPYRGVYSVSEFSSDQTIAV